MMLVVERLLAMSQTELDRHIAAVIENIGTPERGPISQRRAQLLNYVATIGSNGQLANRLVAAGTLNALAVQVKDAPLLEPWVSHRQFVSVILQIILYCPFMFIV